MTNADAQRHRPVILPQAPEALGPDPAQARPRVVCLCGPACFQATFADLNARLTRSGCVVLVIENGAAVPGSADGGAVPVVSAEASVGAVPDDALARAQLHKIGWCDEFVVLNANGFIDEQTRQHIRHAQRLGKRVRFLDPMGGPARVRHLETCVRPLRPACPAPLHGPATPVPEGTVLELTTPFKVVRGAVLLYSADEDRPAATLVSEHVWPGVQWVPEVWYAEAASNTVIAPYSAEVPALRAMGELIRWSVATSGQIWERMLWGLLLVDSVATQEELSAIIGCRRESVTTAMRDFRSQQLIEKVEGRIRLTAKGLTYAAQLVALTTDDGGDGEWPCDLDGLLGRVSEPEDAVPHGAAWTGSGH